MATADGDELSMEVAVSWATAQQQTFQIGGTAYGPSCVKILSRPNADSMDCLVR